MRKNLKNIDYALSVIFSNFAPSTRKQYRIHWRLWTKFLKHEPTGFETTLDANAFFLTVQKRRNHNGDYVCRNTLSAYAKVLKSIYDKLIDFNICKKNPWTKIAKEYHLVESSRHPSILTPFDAVSKLFEVAKTLNNSDELLAMLAILYGAGRRIGELEKIQIKKIKFTPQGHMYISIEKTKNGSDFDAVIPDKYVPYIINLMKGKNENDKLFKTGSRSHYARFKKIARLAGMPYIHPHSARATAITYLLSQGYDYQKVKCFSGHHSISMVALYDKRRFEKDESLALKINF